MNFTISTLEWAANVVTTVSIVLAGRNSVHTWWTGIAGALLFAALFGEAKLYADVVLQGFFIATSVLGWRQWMRSRDEPALPVSRATQTRVVACVIGGVVAAAVYGAVLAWHTDAYAPFADSAVLSFSVVAQLLLMSRRVQTWPFWLAVNSVAVPLFASRGLHLTALLYAAYGVHAIVAWRHWQGLMCTETRVAARVE